ncbi:restriction endonuclease [Rheinheimera muenzenbergensis]|uniref:Restriction endonuclease n=1 Tax=Rheinheimera muenzenbergensis TaxID=1193628 RepID=A0ABU8C2C6_9GAMM|nr:restriction endonuclease [Gammaproteobacteria bacterium]MBU1556820.1 restriction endonuclease [Gammaproteobacteria bacterium]MBU2072095.1 restriction endonuclease [Gammaproteobacteria bacterium]MBU2183516.1 restriction endonuclease [Gammaproteobacteria bacterium]MBU2203426.1 restriction endonuclease [Gammaproteobacteria bacterium]
MNNKWLLISSVSTALGIVAGAVYLLFAEHSLLLSDNSWVLSAFWSAFMLWTFVLMFVVALIFNVLAFFELDEQHQLFGIVSPFKNMLSAADKQQQFIQDAERLLQTQGKLSHSNRVGAEYHCLHGDTDKLVLIQQNKRQVDISQVRALFQQMLAADLPHGLVVSYHGFSNQAWIFAQEANIDLLDAKSLKKQQKRIREQQFALV